MKDSSADIRSLQLPNHGEVNYIAETRSDQNPRIEVEPEGYFRVILPSEDSSAERVLREKESWIQRQDARLAEHIEALDVEVDTWLEKFVLFGEPYDLERVNGQYDLTIQGDIVQLSIPDGRDAYVYLKNRLTDFLRDKVSSYAPRVARELAVEYERVFVRNQKTKWASCSARGNLSFNIRCAFLPEEYLEYLISHEIVHLKHPHHQESFWEELHSLGFNPEKIERKLDGYWILSNRNTIWSEVLTRF